MSAEYSAADKHIACEVGPIFEQLPAPTPAVPLPRKVQQHYLPPHELCVPIGMPARPDATSLDTYRVAYKGGIAFRSSLVYNDKRVTVHGGARWGEVIKGNTMLGEDGIPFVR